MTGDTPSGWPSPKFSFVIDIPGVATNVVFQEVSGLSADAQPIEYRRGTNAAFSTIKMPGIQKTGNVTLKRGIFAKDNKLFDWFNSIKNNSVKRSTITIRLLDERGTPTMTWKLTNAWPQKFSSVDLNASGNEVVIDSIELGHEGLTIETK